MALLLAGTFLLAGESSVFAQGAVLGDDDDDETVDDDSPDADADSDSVTDPDATRLGVGLRLRYVFIPNAIIEAFVESSPGGNANTGFGLEVIRRKGDFEVSFGIEYESLAGKKGIWVDQGEMAGVDDVDEVDYDGFGWIGGDVTFAWHTPVHEKVSLRYGAGIGLGIITGDVLRSDFRCASADLNSCVQVPGMKVREPDPDIPPVFPIVNILLGAQITPTDHIAINIEGGMRTAFYFGTTVAYYF